MTCLANEIGTVQDATTIKPAVRIKGFDEHRERLFVGVFFTRVVNLP
jgi:hypothetical protein